MSVVISNNKVEDKQIKKPEPVSSEKKVVKVDQPKAPAKPKADPAIDGVKIPTISQEPSPEDNARLDTNLQESMMKAPSEHRTAEQTLDDHHKKEAAKARERSGPTTPIVMAIVVGLALLGLGYMAVSSTEDDDSSAVQPQVEQLETQQQVEQIDAASLDQETNAIDELLKEINAIEDIPVSGISDEALAF